MPDADHRYIGPTNPTLLGAFKTLQRLIPMAQKEFIISRIGPAFISSERHLATRMYVHLRTEGSY
jgi:hypothetical protein